MNYHNEVINELINSLLIKFGLSGFILIVIIGWIIWFFFNQKVNRIEQTFVSELEKNRAKDLDLIYRRREVYGRLIKSLRVFLQKADPTEKSTEEKKNEFLAAYDEMYIWAPDKVLKALGKLLDLEKDWAKKKAKAHESGRELEGDELLALQKKYRELHKKCLKEMRKDCGFKDTEFDYKYISF